MLVWCRALRQEDCLKQESLSYPAAEITALAALYMVSTTTFIRVQFVVAWYCIVVGTPLLALPPLHIRPVRPPWVSSPSSPLLWSASSPIHPLSPSSPPQSHPFSSSPSLSMSSTRSSSEFHTSRLLSFIYSRSLVARYSMAWTHISFSLSSGKRFVEKEERRVLTTLHWYIC
jgi:hypothetical protein